MNVRREPSVIKRPLKDQAKARSAKPGVQGAEWDLARSRGPTSGKPLFVVQAATPALVQRSEEQDRWIKTGMIGSGEIIDAKTVILIYYLGVRTAKMRARHFSFPSS